MSRRGKLLRVGFVTGLALVGAVAAEAPGAAPAQTAEILTGPVIEGYGPVAEITDPDFETPLDLQWRVLFDVKSAPESPEALNPAIESVARFLNMHARAGVPLDRMEPVVVLHGAAGKDALDHAGYRARHGVDNPNRELIAALAEAGVRFYLCGQTAAFRGLGRDELSSDIQMALSAMTVMGALQAEGWSPVAF